jgi:molybdenum cofactor cytidylyltransferase
MKFERRPIKQSIGAILAHNISDSEGQRVLRKGTLISKQEIATLEGLGREQVFVAELEDGDIGEAEAAHRIAELLDGENIQLVGAVTGRTNLISKQAGVLHIDVDRLNKLNELPGVTLSTLRDRSVVPDRQMVASIKIIPYGIPANSMAAIEKITSSGPIVTIRPLNPKRIHLMLLGGAPILSKLEADFKKPLDNRVEALGSKIETTHQIATDSEDPIKKITEGLKKIVTEDVDLIIMAGETAIMDSRDLVPTAIENAGGYVETTGAPVDPGNLLMIAYIDALPILGAPGCARSPKENVVDWVLPRLLSDEHLKRSDITSLGHGGLLEDIKERPFPRTKAGGE